MTTPDSTALAALDDDAWFEFYTRIYARALRLAWRITGSRDEAEDVLQRVLCRLLAQAALEHVTHVESYLMTAIRREALNSIRKPKRAITVYDLDATIRTVASPISGPLANAILAEDRAWLARFGVGLAGRQRAVFDLLLDDPWLSRQELAGILGCSRRNIGYLIGRILRKLREHLDDDTP